MKIKHYIMAMMGACMLTSLFSCSGFLDRDMDNIMDGDQIFSDEKMIQSVLANFYGRMDWGQQNGDANNYTALDESIRTSGGPDQKTGFNDDIWRVYDYTFIRNLNQFLEQVRSSKVLSQDNQKRLEGETRFMRAWTYFMMCRGLGGMPILGDKVYDYTGPQDIPSMRVARSMEKDTYNYIIKECDAVASMLPEETQTNAARPNKWAALMLKARAALFAASLAKYNNKMAKPVETEGHECGIPAEVADSFYQVARAVAEQVIKNSPYTLMTNANDPGLAFYKAVSVKENNTEVIWARDRKYPGTTINFTNQNIPNSKKEDQDCAYDGVVLNLVEDFEYKDGRNNRSGDIQTKDANGNYILYDTPDAPFKDKDGRCWGTVIYPGATFAGSIIELQAGQAIINTKTQLVNPELRVAAAGEKDENGDVITSINGPVDNNDQFINKTGFFIRKYLDETPGASQRGRGSEMWNVRFRLAEAYSIAGEAAFELGDKAAALNWFNKLRERGGLKDLTTITFNDIVRENRVEFAMEDHRYYDLKRWRMADRLWNGNSDNEHAMLRTLYPYKVKSTDAAMNGKWIFVESNAKMAPYPLYFQLKNYYNFVDMNWVNNNPLFVKNPYQ